MQVSPADNDVLLDKNNASTPPFGRRNSFARPIAEPNAMNQKSIPVTTTSCALTPAPHYLHHQNGWMNPRLTTVGLYFPLGSTLLQLPKNRLADVLEAFLDVFRKISLHTVYHEGPIAATCRTLDQGEYVISIFGSRENDQELTIEIQRQDGDCVTYHKYAHQIGT
jgi:hypothetical protein